MPNWFSDMRVPKLRISAQKRPNFAQNMHFGYFGPNIGLSDPFGAMADQKTMRTRCLGGFLMLDVGTGNLSPSQNK